jgi:hypothetical protein
MGRELTGSKHRRRDAAKSMRAPRRSVMAMSAVRSGARSLERFRPRLRHVVPAPTLQFIGFVVLLLIAIGFLLTYGIGSPWWQNSDALCKSSALGCGLVIHVLGTGIVAALAFYVVFRGRETYKRNMVASGREENARALSRACHRLAV